MTSTQSATAIRRNPILSPLHVLVVDDDAFIRDMLADMLDTLGVGRVSAASDGTRAVAALESPHSQPDVIICDLNMPGKDGFEVMELIAGKGYRGAVIVLSGMNERVLNSAAVMGRFHRLKVTGVLQKPVAPQALGQALVKAAS